jgi:acetyl-CoA acetyltransferase
MITPQHLSRRVAIVGVGMTRQGDHGQAEGPILAMQALREALADAGLEDKHRIDGLLGAKQYDGSGIEPVSFCRSLGLTPPVTATLDYPTAAFTMHHAAALVTSGICKLVAVVYARNPTGSMREISGAQEYDTVHGFFNAAAVHGMSWNAYMARYGTGTDVLGRIAVKQREHARLNPLAAWTEPLTMDDYFRDEPLIWPLRSLDICKVTAGGVAILVGSADMARDCAKLPVDFLSVGRQATHGLERGEQMSHLSRREMGQQLYGAAGITAKDVDLLYVYDPTTVAVAAALENYEFCEPGGCEAFVGDGERIGLNGSLPVNTHGGHLSEGYLLGLTHHVELVRQLRGECGARQVTGARLAQYVGGGGIRPQFYQAASLFCRGDWNA